ncbi:alpha/beta family hydrolase, partial [Pseudomonas sp. A-RE-8]
MDKQHKASIDGDQWARCVAEHGWLWTAGQSVAGAKAPTLILAHGAGAPMDSGFMEEMSARLAAHGVNVLRFEFPYMAQRRQDGGKRPPNPAPKLLECWREVYTTVRPYV